MIDPAFMTEFLLSGLRPPSLDLAEWLARVCIKLLTPGTTAVTANLIDAALNEKPPQINGSKETALTPNGLTGAILNKHPGALLVMVRGFEISENRYE